MTNLVIVKDGEDRFAVEYEGTLEIQRLGEVLMLGGAVNIKGIGRMEENPGAGRYWMGAKRWFIDRAWLDRIWWPSADGPMLFGLKEPGGLK